MKAVQVLLLFVFSIAIASAQNLRGGVTSDSLTDGDQDRILKKKKKAGSGKEAKKKSDAKKKTAAKKKPAAGAATGSFQDLKSYKQLVRSQALVSRVPDLYNRGIVAAAAMNNGGEGSTADELESMVKKLYSSSGMFFIGGAFFMDRLMECIAKNYIKEIAMGTTGTMGYVLTDVMKAGLSGTM